MHELGIVFSIANQIEMLAVENNLTKVLSITLQVGEISTVVPDFLQKCYPAAVDKSELLHDTELKIEMVPANCICHECWETFSLLKNKNKCPECGSIDTEIVSGREFIIKEIEAC